MSMLNEIYKQQYRAASRKRKREEAIEIINTFIEECQTSKKYEQKMQQTENDINKELNWQFQQLQDAKKRLRCEMRSENMTEERKKCLTEKIKEHQQCIDELKSEENNLMDEVNDTITFDAPLSVFIAIQNIVNDLS